MCRVRARIIIKLIAMVECIVRSLNRGIITALVIITGIIITIVIAALRDLLFAVLRDHLTDTTAIATGMVIATRITMVITAIARDHPIVTTAPATDITQDIIAIARDHLIGTTAPAMGITTPKAMATLNITITAAIIGITQEIATMVTTTPKSTVIIIAENMDTMSTGNTVPATDTITARAGSTTRALLIDTIATTMIIAMVTVTTKITARATITADMATTRRDPSITAVTAMGTIAGSMGTIITEKTPRAMAITRAVATEMQDPSIRRNRGDTIAIDTITIRRDQSIMDMDTDTRNTIAIRKDLSITDMDMDTDTRNIITTRREQSIIPAVTRNIITITRNTIPQSNSIRVHSLRT
jgi:hypothetical protein